MKILIVDDEKFVREELRYVLEIIGECEQIEEASDAEELFMKMKDFKPDVIFLDIELPGESGLIVARKLLEQEDAPAIILATAYEKYAVIGFELNVTDYILKPFSVERTRKALERVHKEYNQLNISDLPDSFKQRICLYKNDRMFLMDLSSVYFFESIERHVNCLTKKGEYQARNSLKDLSEMLFHKGFIRISKSAIVNIENIKELHPWFNYTMKIIMDDAKATELIVNRGYLKAFKQFLGI